MKYRYFATYDSIGDDSGICYDRAELDATVQMAKVDPDCLYFAWERLDAQGEPACDVKVEVDEVRDAFVSGYIAAWEGR